jgi:flagellar biosynthesis/type III secretory pathway protein FliH
MTDAMTNLEKAYLLGYRDGYNRALPTRREINEMVDQIKKEMRAEIEAARAEMRAEIEAARAKAARLLESAAPLISERDPEARLN